MELARRRTPGPLDFAFAVESVSDATVRSGRDSAVVLANTASSVVCFVAALDRYRLSKLAQTHA